MHVKLAQKKRKYESIQKEQSEKRKEEKKEKNEMFYRILSFL